MWQGIKDTWRGLVAWFGESLADFVAMIPGGEWVAESFGLDIDKLRDAAARLAVSEPAAPPRPIFGDGTQRVMVGGKIRVVFDQAPPGMRVAQVRSDNPDVPIDVNAGYVMAGT